MKTMHATLATMLLAACCATAFAAQPEAPLVNTPAAGAAASGPKGPNDDMPWSPHHGPRHGPDAAFEGREFGPGRFHGLQLSEAQRDKLFAIEHAAAPQRREQAKAIHHAHEAMRALRDADRFDEGKAAAASRELGQAIAAEALSEARLHAQLLAVLTPEQREQLRQRRPQPRPDHP